MYRSLFLTTCLVVFSLLISSATMAQEPTTAEGVASSQLDSPAPEAPPNIDASMGTAFTYQGRIKKDGSLVNGTCTMTFSLWDAATGGTQQGATQSVTSVNVSEGLFTVQLNRTGQFGPNAFDGQQRYLEIAVQCPPSAPLTTLTPRQELTAAPYAIHAQRASGVYSTDAFPQIEGNPIITGTDLHLRGRGGGVGNNGGIGRALVDGGSAWGLVVNWGNDFGKVAINGNVGIGTFDPVAKLDVAAEGDAVHINAHSAGIYVKSAHDGILMDPVEGYGINIRKANNGMVITEVADTGVWAQTTNVSGYWGFYTPNKIYGQNVTLRTLTLIAQVAGPTALAVGDVVAVVGVSEPSDTNHAPVPLVHLAGGDDPGGVIGVVEGRMVSSAEPGSAKEADAEGVETLRGAPGLAETGDIVAITVFGIAQVKADASSAPIEAGQRITAAETGGYARTVRHVKYQGVTLAEATPVLGIALQDLPAGQGMVWVFLNPQ